MVSHPPAHDHCPGLTLLPFGGLGLDMAEVGRKVRGLLLVPFLKQEKHGQKPRVHRAPPVLSGIELLLRLSRETLGS